MPQAAQRQLLQLTNALAGQVELVADLLEGAGHPVEEPVTQRQDPALTIGKPGNGTPQAVGDVTFLGDADRIDRILVLDEVTQLGAVFTDRRLAAVRAVMDAINRRLEPLL